MNVRKMTYKELQIRLVENQFKLRNVNVTEERKRILIEEDHDIMMEMDRRLAIAEAKFFNKNK